MPKFRCALVLFAVAMLLTAYFAADVRAEVQSEVSRIQTDLNEDKDFNKALDRLQELLKREPNNVEAHMTCGKVLQYLGYEALANEQYQLADKLDPSQPNSVLSIFHNKLKTQGPVQASEYLQYVQKRFPNDPSVLVMQGLSERMHGDEVKAEYYYREALDKSPNTPGLATTVASLKMLDAKKLLEDSRGNAKPGQSQQASFLKARGKLQEVIALADRDLALKEDLPTANLAKGEALFVLSKFAEAIPFLQTALKGVQDKKSVADLLSRAYIRNGQPAEAIQPTLICLAQTPMKNKFEVDQLKGRLSFILKTTNPAELINSIKIVGRDIRYQETLANLYYASGDVLAKAGFSKEAEEAFLEGLKLYPYSGRPFLRMGILMEQKGDYRKAMENYVRAYQMNTSDREIAARLIRLIKRTPAQKHDLAWRLKDMMHGGRISELKEIDPKTGLP